MRTGSRLLIVDEQPLFVEGLRYLLARAAPQLECTGVDTPHRALERLVAPDAPTLVIADHALGGTARGLALLERIGVCRPPIARALLSAVDDAALCMQARRAGLDGYLTRRLDAGQWLVALRALLAGDRYYVCAPTSSTTLNDRQLSVLRLASTGLCNRRIAEQLHLSERTVKCHLKESFQRLSSSSRTEAVAKASALGLIPPPDHQAIGA